MIKQLPPITKNLLIINIICFLAQLVGEQRGIDLADIFGLHFVLAPDFAPWQVLTYMFLHGSFTHLFFNMFSLWMFGRIVEQTMKRRASSCFISSAASAPPCARKYGSWPIITSRACRHSPA